MMLYRKACEKERYIKVVRTKLAQGFIRPLTPETYHVLAALATRNLYAYGLCEQVELDSGRSVIIGTGSMSNILKNLLSHNWIKVIPKRFGEGVVRYELTSAGQKMLDLEIERLKRAVMIGEIAGRGGRVI